ncbi:hypothetical protein GR210_28680 [Rhizobium leguminosarum]|uniref:hypothetical protein n=1 Tax=Rhizobium leguminosarum TaxID=384 RepID=UPI0013D912C2|nr:hypothetical protein [Rhizobium leguminosarum]MBY5314197.1 hypothetical protein [Rhizobium leguminosarum]NEH52755.1 hypothetical protein [Rhizobium leguminosarum]
MNEYFILAASVFCLLVGIGFCWPPIERYRNSISVGAFGTLLVLSGVVLMTTFKWTDVAIKVSGLEFKLEAAQRAEKLARFELAESEQKLSALAFAASKPSQDKVWADVFKTVAADPASGDKKESIRLVKEALDKSDYTLVPADRVPALAEGPVPQAPPT